MNNLFNIVKTISNFLWDNILVYALLGTGLYFTIRLGFPQIVKFGRAMKEAFGGLFTKKAGKKKPDEAGEVSSFAALATAIAAQVGTGNVAGVATAIMAGGPGAVFWMWMSGILGMGTIFAEAVLAQIYREEKDGSIYGGPSYYMSKGIKNKKLGKVLAALFSVFIILALPLAGNMVQSNSISTSLETAFNIPPVVVGAVLGVLVLLIVAGGIERISKVAETVVPIMALIFIIAGFAIIFKFRANLGNTFKQIFDGAFGVQAVAGGIIGATMKQAMRLGIARGLFSNEAGMGSTPHAHAVADVPHPGNQGLVAIAGVVVDTLIICTMTALIILLPDAHMAAAADGSIHGAAVTQLGFTLAYGRAGEIFLAVSLLFFAFTTIIGWYYFGESNIMYLFGKKALTPFRILVGLAVFVGTLIPVATVWDLSDFFNALMVLPNVIAVLLLSNVVVKSKKEFDLLDKK